MRRLGVYGENLPTKKERTVQPADFSVAGIVAKFERKFNKAFGVRSVQEAQEIFGSQIDSSAYGWDSVNGFFANTSGYDATLFISSHVGHTGSAIDAVVATANIADGTPASVLKIDAAYQEEPEYGISGNRTGYTVELGNRFSTALNGGVLTGALTATLDSVVGVRVGDIMHFTNTGGTYHEYHKITSINETAKTVTWAAVSPDAAWGGTGGSDNDYAYVLGFKLHIWRKDMNGVVAEVDTDLSKVWCTTESAVVDFYVQNVYAASKWVKVTRLATSPATLDKTMPAAVSTVTYMASGADGTVPTTAAHWNKALTNLDNIPVRLICNPETVTDTIQQAIETYCKAREDNPVALLNVTMDRTKAQLLDIGHGFQRSNEVDAIIVANWLEVADPFATSGTAPNRKVPNVGHLMGWWLASVQAAGIHVIPARKSWPLQGVRDIVGDQILSDFDRTDLAEAGVNVIQNITGYGMCVRNLFTCSTDVVYRYSNGLLMRNFIKISCKDSLQESENTPNDIGHVIEDRMACLNFLFKIYQKGSNGNIIEGESFGKYQKADGSYSTRNDAIEVVADATNNPVGVLNAGERNIDIYFTFPAPAGSIKIGVGVIYKVA